MSRILPYPLLWVALLAMWLLLSDSLAPGQWLLGAVVATLASLAMRRLQPPRPAVDIEAPPKTAVKRNHGRCTAMRDSVAGLRSD